MPERSLSLTALPAEAGAEKDGELIRSLAPLLSEWLPRQRWFAGKGRPVSGFGLVAATEILPCTRGGTAPGLIHLLVRARQPDGPGTGTADPADLVDLVAPLGLEGLTKGTDGADSMVGMAEGGSSAGDCYQLLFGVRNVLPPTLAPALVGRPGSGPLHGRAVYDALHDPYLTSVLLERLRAPGRLGPLRFTREAGTGIPSGLRPRPLAAEQSNSSLVYGSSYILKLFRRVGPGLNPDLELPLALARSGCGHVPAPTAWFETPSDGSGRTGPAPLTLGVLQPFLPDSEDGWKLALRALAEQEDFTGAAHGLGRATAQVHTGLASALPTTVLHSGRLEKLAAGMAERLEAASTVVPALRPYRSALQDAFRAVAGLGRDGHRCAAQRVHGDLHLGQVLRGPDGRWTLIDFEGEPDRPLAERRLPQPVVRDIAGMLRSFDYAASQRGGGLADPESARWAAVNRAAFCAGYAEASGSDPRDQAVLLRAYETDKAIYEVLYEARHRPSWLPIPLAAIRRLASPQEV